MFGRAGLVALVAAAACTAGGRKPPVSQCDEARGAPIANIGPDITLTAPCGGEVVGAVASINEPGAGSVEWSASLTGDSAISLEGATVMGFVTTEISGPTVLRVTFRPPADAKPGDSFDAVVAVSAYCGDFPPGMVKVHAEVRPPRLAVAPPTVDFGYVPLGSTARQTLLLRNDELTMISLGLSGATPPFAAVAPPAITQSNADVMIVSVSSATPGDFSTVLDISMTPNGSQAGGLPPSCSGMISVPVHARIVGGDGGADADASADATADVP